MRRNRSTRVMLGAATAAVALFVGLLGGAAPSGAAQANTFTALQMPALASGTISQLSCPSQNDCVALGLIWLDPNNLGDVVPGFASETSGSWSSFQAVTVASGANLLSLTSLSCWAAGHCLAVGYQQHFVGGFSEASTLAAYELSGGTWTELTIPSFTTAPTSVRGASVSCVAPGVCRILGRVTIAPRGATVDALLDTWSAGIWNTRPLPVPPDTYDLGSLSCYSVSACAATLTTTTWPRVFRTYLGRLGPLGWKLSWPLGWAHLSFPGVRCPTVSTCTASGATSKGVVLSSQANGWGTSDVVPNSAGDTGSFSCSGATCVVLGYVMPSADWGQGGPPGSQEPVWTRTSGPWDPAIFTVPPPLRFVMFTDGSCSQGQCTVVGFASLPPTGGEYSPSVPVVATVP